MKKAFSSLLSIALMLTSTAIHAAYYLYINNLQATQLEGNYIATWPYLVSSVESQSSNVHLYYTGVKYYQFKAYPPLEYSATNSNKWKAVLKVADLNGLYYCRIEISGSVQQGYKVKMLEPSHDPLTGMETMQCVFEKINSNKGQLDIYSI